MRAADKAKLRLRVGIFPYDRVLRLYALKLRIVDDVNLGVFGNERLAKLLRFGRETVNMVKPHCAV